MEPQFLASDYRPEGVRAICERVYPLLYGTADVTEQTPPIYERRETAAEWNGYEGCWYYHLKDGRIVEQERQLTDDGVSFTNWYLIPPPPERPHKTWHGDFEQPHTCVACEKEHGEDCCGRCEVWKARVAAATEARAFQGRA